MELEKLGMAAFIGFEESHAHLSAGIPESSGISDAEIAQLPEYVRNFKCEGKLENGDPYCKAEKFTKYICTTRGKKTNWHPGM
jgi:hypothetical protein